MWPSPCRPRQVRGGFRRRRGRPRRGYRPPPRECAPRALSWITRDRARDFAQFDTSGCRTVCLPATAPPATGHALDHRLGLSRPLRRLQIALDEGLAPPYESGTRPPLFASSPVEQTTGPRLDHSDSLRQDSEQCCAIATARKCSRTIFLP
jgi:hypothetical protein